MDNVLRNCFIARLFIAFKIAYPDSIPGKIQRRLADLYAKSFTKRILYLFFSVSPNLVYSKYYKVLNKFNCFFYKIGIGLRAAAKQSIIFRCCRVINDSKVVEQSAILRSIRTLGIRGLLLIAFGLYLPLDVFIRNVIKIDLLSSIWDEAFLLFSVLFILWRMMTSETCVKPRTTPVDAPLLVFLCVGLLLMVIVSPSQSIAFAGYRAVCEFMLWFFVLTRLIEDDFGLKVLYYTISIVAVGVALHGVYQYVTGAPMPSNWVASSEVGMRTRVYSITGSPNIMGALMVMTAPMLAALAYYFKPIWLKCVMWGCTFIICLAVLFTFSRGAWFGLAVAILIFSLRVDRKLLLLAIISGLGLILFVPEISNRITFLFTSDFAAANSTGGRGERWPIGLMLLRTNPVFGFGLGRFGGAIAMQNQVIDGLEYFYMDNYYLKTLVEMGYIGLTGYLFLLLSNVVWGLRGMFKTRHNRVSLLSSGMFAGMAGVMAHSFFENIFEVPYMNAYFWGFAAAVMYISYLRRKTSAAA